MKIIEYPGDHGSLTAGYLEEVSLELGFKGGLEESRLGGRMEGGHLSRGMEWAEVGRKAGVCLGCPPAPPCAPSHVTLGGLQAVADLLQVDYEMHKMTQDPLNLALRRYAGMTLTNLTFGDVANKVPGVGRWRQCFPPPLSEPQNSREVGKVVSL